MKKNTKLEKAIDFLAVIIILFFGFYITNLHFEKILYIEYPGFDDFLHLNKAKFISESNFLNLGWSTFEENRGKALLPHYAPLYHIFLAFLLKIGLMPENIIFRILNLLPSISSYFIFYFFTKKYLKQEIAFFSLLCFLSSPIMFAQSQLIHPDSFFILTSVLMLVAFMDILLNKNNSNWKRNGLLFFLAIFTKYNAAAVIFSLFLILIIKKIKFDYKPFIFSGILFGIWLILLALGMFLNKMPLSYMGNILSDVSVGRPDWDFFIEIFSTFGFFLPILSIFSIYSAFKIKKSQNILFSFPFFFLLIYLIITNHFDWRFFIPIFPLLSVSSGISLKEIFELIKSEFKIKFEFPLNNIPVILIFILLFGFLNSSLRNIVIFKWVLPTGVYNVVDYMLKNENTTNIICHHPFMVFWYDKNNKINSISQNINDINNISHIIIINPWCKTSLDYYTNVCRKLSSYELENKIKFVYMNQQTVLYKTI